MELKVWKISPWTNLTLREDFLFQSDEARMPWSFLLQTALSSDIHLMVFYCPPSATCMNSSANVLETYSYIAIRPQAHGSLVTLVLQLAIIDGRRLIEELTTQLGILLNKPCGAEHSQALQFSSDNRVSFSF